MNIKKKLLFIPLFVMLILLFIITIPYKKIIISSTSPDGKTLALVKDKRAWWIDGPVQSLFLKIPSSRKPTELEKLGEDTDYCTEIKWSPDGKVVGFLITGRYLKLYDVPNVKLIKNLDLVPYAVDYPPNPQAREVEFIEDGLKLKYKIFRREETKGKLLELIIR